jgi:outer membrane PBP1 activator LpoA protein
VNVNFSKSNSSLRYELVVHDTESDPTVSLEKLRLLAKEGIRIVIGPATSAELKATKDFADKNDIILFSPSSTAPSLAVEGDNVFRLVPDDSHQAKAISKMMWDQGIRLVVPFWRDDVYGSELMQAVRANFQALGGEFDKYAEKLGYAPRTGHLAASLHRINFIMWDNALKVLESRLQSTISQYGIDKVGVYMVSLDEVSPIFIQAYSHPVLSKVKWYGSDGSALNDALVRNY